MLWFDGDVICVVSNGTATRFWHSSPEGPPEPFAHLDDTVPLIRPLPGPAPQCPSGSLPSAEEVPCPAVRRGSASPRRLSGSNNTGTARASFPEYPTRKQRRRLSPAELCEQSVADVRGCRLRHDLRSAQFRRLRVQQQRFLRRILRGRIRRRRRKRLLTAGRLPVARCRARQSIIRVNRRSRGHRPGRDAAMARASAYRG